MKKEFVNVSTVENWFEWCRSLLDLYDTDKHFYYNGQVYKNSYFGMQNWILAQKFTGKNFLYSRLLLDAILSADKIPGAGVYVPWFLYDTSDITNDIKRLSAEDYLKETIKKSKNVFAINLFKKIHELSGPLTKIVVKSSSESDTVIRMRNSYEFKLTIDPHFHRMIGSSENIELVNPIIIMIEGAPETIGEINPLLQKNHESGRPVVLISRSFPEEISATLGTNWVRNSLSILPILYGDCIETINLAADICSITKGELISPHFGDIIPAVILDTDKWGMSEKVEYSHGKLSIYSNSDTSRHVSSLIQKLKSADNEDLKNMITDRILSLSNDALEVWIPKDKKHILDEIDCLVKHYGGFVTSGMVHTSVGNIPKSFAESASTAAKTLRKEILNIGGFLVRTEDEVVVR